MVQLFGNTIFIVFSTYIISRYLPTIIQFNFSNYSRYLKYCKPKAIVMQYGWFLDWWFTIILLIYSYWRGQQILKFFDTIYIRN